VIPADSRTARGGESHRPVAAEIVFRGLQILPISRNLGAARIDLDEVAAYAGIPSFPQKTLNDRFSALIFAFAELVVADLAIGIDDVHRGPILIAECAPYPVVAIDGDRIIDPKCLHGRSNVVDVPLEPEFGRVHANHDQSLILVLVGPGTNIGLCALSIDAGVGPEVDEHYLASQSLRRQRLRVEPAGGAGEGRQRTFDG
jgi:hypothetical protein